MKTIEELQKFVEPVFKLLPENSFWIAGGAINNFLTTGKNESDFDCYFESEEELKNTYDYLDSNYDMNYIDGCANVLSDTDNGILINIGKNNQIKIHLIRKEFFPSPEDVINSFDFTVCCGIIGRDFFHCHDQFFNHLENKKIVVNNFNNKVTLLPRLIKYINKGYSIDKYELNRINSFLQGVELEVPQEDY